MRLQDWRTDPKLVAIAREELQRPGVKAMIAMLKDAHPADEESQRILQPHETIESHGVIKGYSRCIRTLESLSEMIPVFREPTATFESPAE